MPLTRKQLRELEKQCHIYNAQLFSMLQLAGISWLTCLTTVRKKASGYNPMRAIVRCEGVGL